MARADKVAAVAELTDRFKDSDSVVLTEYRGLSVTQLSLLREALGENATFSVVKNTLTKIAVSEAGLDDQLASLLSGPSAIAFVGGDVVEAAKGLRDFSRDNPALVIKGGVLDGKALTPAEITQLADLEPRDVLLAKLAGAMTAFDGPRRRGVQRTADAGRPARRGPTGPAGRAGRRRGRGGGAQRGRGAPRSAAEEAPGAPAEGGSES